MSRKFSGPAKGFVVTAFVEDLLTDTYPKYTVIIFLLIYRLIRQYVKSYSSTCERYIGYLPSDSRFM